MITQKQIQDITQHIVGVLDPKKILLFGSYAKGTANEHSDLDLLVIVENSDLPKAKRVISLYNSLGSNYNFPKDILIRTISEVEEWKNVRQAFITSVASEGKVLYEK